jgi:membrane protein YdbS with pleckstrin-like domain
MDSTDKERQLMNASGLVVGIPTGAVVGLFASGMDPWWLLLGAGNAFLIWMVWAVTLVLADRVRRDMPNPDEVR